MVLPRLSTIYILEYPPIDSTRRSSRTACQKSEKRGPLKTSNINQTQFQQDGEKQFYLLYDFEYLNGWAISFEKPALQMRTDSTRHILNVEKLCRKFVEAHTLPIRAERSVKEQ